MEHAVEKILKGMLQRVGLAQSLVNDRSWCFWMNHEWLDPLAGVKCAT